MVRRASGQRTFVGNRPPDYRRLNRPRVPAVSGNAPKAADSLHGGRSRERILESAKAYFGDSAPALNDDKPARFAALPEDVSVELLSVAGQGDIYVADFGKDKVTFETSVVAPGQPDTRLVRENNKITGTRA